MDCYFHHLANEETMKTGIESTWLDCDHTISKWQGQRLTAELVFVI